MVGILLGIYWCLCIDMLMMILDMMCSCQIYLGKLDRMMHRYSMLDRL